MQGATGLNNDLPPSGALGALFISAFIFTTARQMWRLQKEHGEGQAKATYIHTLAVGNGILQLFLRAF